MNAVPESPAPTRIDLPAAPALRPARVLLLGATGTIGRATARALVRRGHAVVGLMRAGTPPPVIEGCRWRQAEVADAASLAHEGLAGERFDAVVSCLASRHGAPADAWAIDHRAHRTALQVALAAQIPRWVQLSAICLQKPRLQFQHAKLAFEAELQAAPLAWTIVRPTAYFKSLSGQVERVRAGRPFLLFGDGQLTACKPIADEDLADYLVDRVEEPLADTRRIRPIGGPGAAITPREQGELLFRLLGRPPKFKSVPVAMMDAICATLGGAARLWPPLERKAEFARIGRYYATESMLVWDAAAGRYDAEATPSTGARTLAGHYQALLAGTAVHERGEHTAF